MANRYKQSCVIVLAIFLIAGLKSASAAASISERLAGRILLQIEAHGEAWYVNPENNLRYYLGRPDDAFALMRKLGVGIANHDLIKIPIGLSALSGDDRDGDGLSDRLEDAIGTDSASPDTDQDGFSDYEEITHNYNPAGTGKFSIDSGFSAGQAGRILLQVEAHGEAWYVNPADMKRYFLGRPADAFALMRGLGLGINENDIDKIPIRSPNYNYNSLELIIHEKVNRERLKTGLSALAYNNELARVAREHSANLARENESLTGMSASCDFPLIHHEGFDFGIYNQERLNARGIYYYKKLGENIALVTAAEVSVKFGSLSAGQAAVASCQDRRSEFEEAFSKRIHENPSDQDKLKIAAEEIAKRQAAFAAEKQLEIMEIEWLDADKIAANTVDGWMKSEGHRENILKAGYGETGIGSAEINGYIITTQIFIERADCGYFGGVCCEEEGYYPYCYEPYECTINICE